MSSIIQTVRFADDQRRDTDVFYYIIQTVGFADDQRRDIDVFYYTDGLFRRCTTATFQSLLHTEAFTSPLYNGEVSICNI